MFSYAIKLLFVVISLSSTTYSFPYMLNGNDWTITSSFSNLSATGTIPGTIHTILLASHLIPDPYLDFNDVQLRYLVRDDWIFRKSFNLTNDILASDEIQLYFAQIDTIANLTLNGEWLGETSSMFIPYSFYLNKASLREHENLLEINFQSPVVYAANQSLAYNSTVFPLCPPEVQNGECHVQFIRKEPCSFSWDWVHEMHD